MKSAAEVNGMTCQRLKIIAMNMTRERFLHLTFHREQIENESGGRKGCVMRFQLWPDIYKVNGMQRVSGRRRL